MTAVYSSPLVRALHTALPLARKLGLEPVLVPDLREIDFGELEGLGHPELEERYPAVPALDGEPGRGGVPGRRVRG